MIYPIIGMSPGNSYFNDENVRYVLQKTIDLYNRTAVLIPDLPAIATYEALGYTEPEARNKAILKGNNLRNRTNRIAEELGIVDKIRIIDWKNEIEDNDDYKKHYANIRNLYLRNHKFCNSVNETTSRVLENSDKEIPDISKSVKIATHYLLSELAFLEFAPQYLQADKVIYLYHRPWPVYEDYLSGAFDSIPKSYLGFQILHPADPSLRYPFTRTG